jgi:hypothetical protein
MKHILFSILVAVTTVLSLQAATPAEEKAFLDAYKKAFEAGDTKTLESFLYTKGADPEALEFFKLMMFSDAGQKLGNIELVTPTAEQMKKLNEPMEMPDGKKYVMPLKPVKQLVITVEKKDASGTSKSTHKSPVAENDGKLVIPVPVPSK